MDPKPCPLETFGCQVQRGAADVLSPSGQVLRTLESPF